MTHTMSTANDAEGKLILTGGGWGRGEVPSWWQHTDLCFRRTLYLCHCRDWITFCFCVVQWTTFIDSHFQNVSWNYEKYIS